MLSKEQAIRNEYECIMKEIKDTVPFLRNIGLTDEEIQQCISDNNFMSLTLEEIKLMV